MEKFKKLLIQALKFALVGALNTAVDFIVYSLLVRIPFFKEYYLLAQVISYSCGVANSLFFNKRWTFAQKERMSLSQLGGFIAVNLFALGVSSGILYLLREGALLTLISAKIFATAGSLIVNFMGNRIFVFKKTNA